MHPGLLVLGGFVLGTAGMKAVQSRAAHKAYVRGTVCALQCKDYVSRIVDEAKANCDDILAEAEQIKEAEAAECAVEEIAIEEVVEDTTESAPARRSRSRQGSAKQASPKKKS